MGSTSRAIRGRESERVARLERQFDAVQSSSWVSSVRVAAERCSQRLVREGLRAVARRSRAEVELERAEADAARVVGLLLAEGWSLLGVAQRLGLSRTRARRLAASAPTASGCLGSRTAGLSTDSASADANRAGQFDAGHVDRGHAIERGVGC